MTACRGISNVLTHPAFPYKAILFRLPCLPYFQIH